jgi:hypothetical protein
MDNPKFLQNFRPKNNTLRKKFDYYFLIPAILIQAWHSKVKTIIPLYKIVRIS